ncbi:MAG TPA: hypothetical protein VGL66_00270 [Caulobacteraceae bacterium]|jgi:hypothetical protein
MRPWFVAGLACLSLTACSLPSPDKDADALAQRFVGEIASGADLSKDADVDPQLTGPQWVAQRASLQAMFPQPKPDSVKSTGWSINTKAGEGTRAELRYSYVYGKQTPVAATVVLRKPEGKTKWIATGLQAHRDAGPVALGEPPAPDSSN